MQIINAIIKHYEHNLFQVKELIVAQEIHWAELEHNFIL